MNKKIGKRVGNINILKARLKQAEVNLEKYLKDIQSKENKLKFLNAAAIAIYGDAAMTAFSVF